MARRRRRYDDDAPRQRRDSAGATIARVLIGGSVMGCMLVLAIVFVIGVIVAIRINEARRHGQGPWAKPPKIEIDPPGDPPPFMPPPVEAPPPEQPIQKALINLGPDGTSRTQVVGGGNDPQFEDKAPPGGMLIGLEIAVIDNNSIKSIRPIYLVQGKEVKGTQVGNARPNVTLKAKEGHAVSALIVNAGLWLDGMSLTFARVNNGKLNLNDTYQSPYYGGSGGGRFLHGGNGMNVVGVVLKRNPDASANGIGLLLK